MTQRSKDLTTLAFTAPFVMARRMAQMADGSMTSTEFARMWVEKPVAVATSLATLQVEMAMSTMAAFGNPFFKQKSVEVMFGKALRPYAKAVSANHRRLG